ncbi:MAG: hypothetical protein ACE5R4_18660 [Armatimonadota bacterium]
MPRLCILLPAVVCGLLLALTGCGRGEEKAGAEGGVRVERYNVNMVEAKDIVDVYAEAVNTGERRSAPMRVRAVLAPDGEPLAADSAYLGRLEPGGRREVSLHLTGCTGRLRQRDLSVFAEESTEAD